MEIADVMVALGGDKGNTVPKYGVSVSEVAVLRAIHGDDAVFDIKPTGERAVSNRDELERLRLTYGGAKDGEGNSILGQMFPGAAARVFQTFDELDLPEFLLLPTQRVSTKVEAAPAPTKRAKKAAAAEPAPEPVQVAVDDDGLDDDGIADMPSVME